MYVHTLFGYYDAAEDHITRRPVVREESVSWLVAGIISVVGSRHLVMII